MSFQFMNMLSNIERRTAEHLIDLAIEEDVATIGDITSLSTIPEHQQGRAAFVARSGGVIAGLPIAEMVCHAVDASLVFTPQTTDSAIVPVRATIAIVEGSMRSILIAERTALNFLQRMTGIATLTAQYVAACAGTRAQVLDTRKTIPAWRVLDKYSVRCGGGANHRFGLYDAILIKDNHIAAQGAGPSPVRRAVEAARAYPGNAELSVEVEVDSLDQLREVLPVQPEIVLLDNMVPAQLREAIRIRDALSPKTLLEASGGVNLNTIAGTAATGVDRISVGAITHSAPAADIALDYLA